MSSLRVVTYATFADAIRDQLTVPADVIGVATEHGPDMADAVRDADVLVNGAYLAEWRGTTPRLRLVHGVGAGYDGIDLPSVPDGCLVANVYGHEYGIAEYVFMTMAALNREMPQA